MAKILISAAAVGAVLLLLALGFAALFRPREAPSEHEVL